MNKIFIHRGDSTIFADINKFLTFTIDTELDLTGWSARFVLGFVTIDIPDISAKSFDVNLTQEDTIKLKFGLQHGTLILTDNKGNVKTICNDIPFEVTNDVIENDHQIIDLTVPTTSGVDFKLEVGYVSVSSVNGKRGDVILKAEDVGALPDSTVIPSKTSQLQNDNNLAYVKDIPTLISQLQNDLGFQTLADVMGIIASIPQFKLSIVNDLPTIGEKMTLYLVPKEESTNDVYNEYIWIEQTSSFELIGTTAVDLTDYVKNTDFATQTVGGVVKMWTSTDEEGNIGLNISTEV